MHARQFRGSCRLFAFPALASARSQICDPCRAAIAARAFRLAHHSAGHRIRPSEFIPSRSAGSRPPASGTLPTERTLSTEAAATGYISPAQSDFAYAMPTSLGQSSTLSSSSSNAFSVLDIPYSESESLRQGGVRISAQGIACNMQEGVPLFQACLRVGRLERARLFLERALISCDSADIPQLAQMQSQYILAYLRELLAEPDKAAAAKFHAWYQRYVHRTGMPVTAITIACTIKFALLSGVKDALLAARINEYMASVDYDGRLEVLSLAEILSPKDVSVISQMSSELLSLENTGIPEAEFEDGGPKSPEVSQKDVPAVVPMFQKGSGLNTLKSSLSFLENLPTGQDFESLSKDDLREVQMKLERDALDSAIQTWRRLHQENIKKGFVDVVSPLGSLLSQWQADLEDALKQEVKAVDMAEASPVPKPRKDIERCHYGPLLRVADTSRLAALTIVTLVHILASLGADTGAPMAHTVQSLGIAIEEDVRHQHQKSTSRSKAVVRRTLPQVLAQHKKRARKLAKREQAGESVPNDEMQAWPPQLRLKVAGAVLDIAIKTCKVKAVKEHPETKEIISEYQPAFAHSFKFKKGGRLPTLKANPYVVKLLLKEPRPELLVSFLPMIIPPDPWTKFDRGCYLDSPVQFIRTKIGEVDQRIYAEAAIARGDVKNIFKALDILGSVPWKINQPVLDVMIEAWNSGKEYGNIPPLDPQIPMPPEPTVDDDPIVRYKWEQEAKRVENEKSGLRSSRCFINYQLDIARAFRNHTIYFPHNLDFRGRAYPIPPILNHMGADNARGVLLFAQGKPLGKKGLRWLKIHLSNLYGFDKASLDEREEFINRQWSDVMDSASNPLNGKQWWLKAEDPWQALATCFELKKATDSPNPEEFVSHLPVHQDGTCNGLQHYAALGGDEWGAKQVNLHPGDRPADVYTAVADLVKEIVKADVDTGSSPFAAALLSKITRKVVKQTVMTNVYGVTFTGARIQIQGQLEDLYPKLPEETGESYLWCATYLTTCVFKALGTMFSGARQIQAWLGACGKRICRSLSPEQIEQMLEQELDKQGSRMGPNALSDDIKSRLRNTLIWTTPLGLPVAQPYRQLSTRNITTCIMQIKVPIPDRGRPVDARKQLQGFPPNFIHSLDATHMLLSALDCHERGINFAAVHDSYWTHACDVDAMSDCLRNAFVRIHRESAVGRLKAEFEVRYQGSLCVGRCDSSSPAGKKITKWRSKNPMTFIQECFLEYRRLKLLSSTNKTEVEEGQAMVTPASIMAEFGAADVISEDVDDVVGPGGKELYQDVSAASQQTPIEDSMANQSFETAGEPSDASELDPAPSLPLNEPAPAQSSVKAKSKKVSTKLLWMPLEFPSVPPKGFFDIREVLKSQYFFS